MPGTRPSEEEYDLCVLFVSDDLGLATRLVELLRESWTVWWAEDIAHGDWEQHVRSYLPRCRAVVPLLSSAVRGRRSAILRDEMSLAQELGKPILPFVIGKPEIPMGFGGANRTPAEGWRGDTQDPGFQKLRHKVTQTVGPKKEVRHQRPKSLAVGSKKLQLPTFALSISSFETRLPPVVGLTLLRGLGPGAVLVSAYDAWHLRAQETRFGREFRRLMETETVVFLDSGNYEASRRNDYWGRANPGGWRVGRYHETVAACRPDLAFQFDAVDPKGSIGRVARSIIATCQADQRKIGAATVICPIVHVPVNARAPAAAAASIVAEVAAAIDPLLIAIPERELGNGLRERFAAVLAMRASLDRLPRYYPLHLLGTGNPLSMAAFAAAGADSFDGLEWCRTVADFRSAALYHFQQFDMVGKPCLARLTNVRARAIASNDGAPYASRVLSYNLDFFEDWSRTMWKLIHAGQEDILLNYVPDIGPLLYADFRRAFPEEGP